MQIYRYRWSFPNRFARASLVLFSIAAVVSHYKQQWYALEPMVTLLIIAFVLKLLELRRQRDALVLVFVGYFVAACARLFNQGIIASLTVLLALWLLTACLLVLQCQRARYLSRRSVRTTSLLLLQATPIMLLMLFVFPRLGALWSVPVQGSASTGMSTASG